MNYREFTKKLRAIGCREIVRRGGGSHRKEELSSLRQQVETFPVQLEAAVEKAVSEATEALTRDFGKDKALMESKFQGEKNVLSSKIEALEELVANQSAQITGIAQGREDAYEKVQDIANKAIAAAKREIISVPVPGRSTAKSDED